MSDWTQQAQTMVDRWTKLQKEWLTSLTEAYGSAESQRAESTEQARHRMLEVWQESVKAALDAQAELVRLWASGVEAMPAAAEARRAQQTQDVVGRWIDGQRQLWDNWLSLAQGAQSKGTAAEWEEAGQRVLRSLQDATEKAIEAQAAWAKSVAAK